MSEQQQFDPSDHTVAEVQAHLADASVEEFQRVQALEEGGAKRKGVLEYVQDPSTASPEPDEDGYTRIVVSS